MDQEPLPRSWSIKELIDIGPKVGVTVAAVCYVVGLLIVNTHLAQYEVYSSDLVRAEYVLAGLAFLALVGCAGVASHYCVVFIKGAARFWKEKRYLRATVEGVGVALGGLAIATELLEVISDHRLGGYGKWRTWAAVGTFVLTYGFLRSEITDLSKVMKALQSGDENSAVTHAWWIVWVVAQLLVQVGFYATLVYPYVSPEYGGGHRDAVVLLPTQSGLEVSRRIGLPVRQDNSIGPVQLLLSTDKELIIARADSEEVHSHAVRLARDLIEAMAVDEPANPKNNASAKAADNPPNVPAQPGTPGKPLAPAKPSPQ